jgi:hypothetical protein
MARFTIENTKSSQSVQVELTFNANPLGSNTWSIGSGDASTLPVASGKWNAAGGQNVLVIREDSEKEILRLDPITISVVGSLTDPFQDLEAGVSSGGGIFSTGDPAGWTFDSR